MPKVISRKPEKSVLKTVICKDGCGAKIEYVPNDVKRRDGTDIGGGPDGAEWVDCPDCGKKAVIRAW